MRYRISHRTAYRYASPAYESVNEVRLRPVSDETQNCPASGAHRPLRAEEVVA